MKTPSRYRQAKNRPGRILNIFRRFYSENMMQTSTALAFTTLMALVPLVAVVLAVASAVPYFDLLVARLDLLIRGALLPSGAAGAIAGNIARFSHQAQRLTIAGIALLGVTAFMLLHTIERAFNHLWQVNPRPLLARLRLYAFVIVLWPFILGAIAGLMSFAVTTSLGFFDESFAFRRFAWKAVAALLLGLFFSFLYFAVPNAQVTRKAALTGGIFAALAFGAMQKIFEIFFIGSAMLKSIYGAFAAFPVFLVWLQMSWAVVLFGGLVVATLSRPEKR